MADDEPRHTAWDALLETYVDVSEDGVNRFDYAALKANAEDRRHLDDYLDSFADLDVSAFDMEDQLAAYSNIYNALTVKHIVERYPIRSIRTGYISGPWKRVKTEINGERVSLDAIEHDILRPMGDERIHYAINCASYSCPNLLPDAFEGESWGEMVDQAASDYINHPRGVRLRDRGGLEVSEIYKWFREDFGGSEAALIEHFLAYAEPELAAQIESDPDIKRYRYDWSLNDVQSTKG